MAPADAGNGSNPCSKTLEVPDGKQFLREARSILDA